MSRGLLVLAKTLKCCYLQFFQLLEFRKQADRQLTDTVFIDFKLIELNQRLKCTSIKRRNLIVVQKSVKQNKRKKEKKIDDDDDNVESD